MMQENERRLLTRTQLKVWNTLRSLADGERIIGRDLMLAAQIPEERKFHSDIETLRSEGYQIGASKGLHNPGYYQIKTDREAWDYHFRNVHSLENEIDRITENTKKFFLEKYGNSFDFYRAKDEEELRIFGEEIN